VRKKLRKESAAMMAKLKLQQQFARQNFVQDVMDRDKSLPIPVHKERIGRIFPKNTLPTIGFATLIAFTMIGLISNPVLGAGIWRRRANMPTKRAGLSTGAVNGKIYAIGGGISQGDVAKGLKTVEVYDPVTNTWTKKASMPTPRFSASISVVNGKIYNIGGYGGGVDVLSTIEEYDPVTDKWIRKADMPTKRQALSASEVKGKIYAIGGAQWQGKWVTVSTVEEYDAAADTWTKKADMPTKRAGLSTSVVNGKIYAIGGWIPWRDVGKVLKTVEVYDPATDTWAKGADMPMRRCWHSASAVKGKIYAIGGMIVTGVRWAMVSEVEVYNPAADRWTKKRNMPTRRGWHAASAVNEKIYVIGGASRCVPGKWECDVLSTVEEYDTGFAVDARGKLPTLWGRLKVK
jgi:N-acetylneuraminic acid mutarotase